MSLGVTSSGAGAIDEPPWQEAILSKASRKHELALKSRSKYNGPEIAPYKKPVRMERD